jgi:Flp pilus assembly protein TadD
MDPPSTSSIDQAVDAYETTVLLAPTVAGYHTALGATLARQGDYILSRLILERAVALDPTDPSAYAFLAATYTALGETDLALNAENQAYDGSKKP